MEDKKSNNILNERGQSTVEYLLLLVVITSFITIVLKSPAVKQWVGGDKSLYEAMARSIEFSFRYGHAGIDDDYSNNYSDPRLKTYSNEDGNASRFFAPQVKYNE